MLCTKSRTPLMFVYIGQPYNHLVIIVTIINEKLTNADMSHQTSYMSTCVNIESHSMTFIDQVLVHLALLSLQQVHTQRDQNSNLGCSCTTDSNTRFYPETGGTEWSLWHSLSAWTLKGPRNISQDKSLTVMMIYTSDLSQCTRLILQTYYLTAWQRS